MKQWKQSSNKNVSKSTILSIKNFPKIQISQENKDPFSMTIITQGMTLCSTIGHAFTSSGGVTFALKNESQFYQIMPEMW